MHGHSGRTLFSGEGELPPAGAPYTDAVSPYVSGAPTCFSSLGRGPYLWRVCCRGT